ncbi:MAG: VOC family protein [Pseudomonadota bacterium]
MTIEACIKCRDITTALSFYTEVMDFDVEVAPDPDPTAFMSKYALLKRGNSLLHLSSHEGDGVFGNLIYVRIEDIEELFSKFKSRGINTKYPDRYPSVTIPLTEQTWGMKEFSVRDHDGNKITFGQDISN